MTGDSYGAYAGQPLSFACARCRKSDAWRHARKNGRTPRRGTRWVLTGKTRAQRSEGSNHHGWPDTAHQYRCLDCGHVGWSRHPGVTRYAQKEEDGEGRGD